jgi:hypothetical protein
VQNSSQSEAKNLQTGSFFKITFFFLIFFIANSSFAQLAPPPELLQQQPPQFPQNPQPQPAPATAPQQTQVREASEEEICKITEEYHDQILEQVKQKNPDAISVLPNCFKLDRKLILKASMLDPSQFKNASEILKGDENFIRRMVKVNPQILQFIAPKLRRNRLFMQRAIYLNREALQYADPALLDNKQFMKKMIDFDSENYKYASERLRAMPDLATIAFKDNGLLLAYAPENIRKNRKVVKIAVTSNSEAFQYAADEVKIFEEIELLSYHKTSIKSKADLEDFLQKNYVKKGDNRNIGTVIGNQAKFFKKREIISRNYITKWQRHLTVEDGKKIESFHLISADSRNYPILWKRDLRKHPDLIKKIEKFFLKRNVDEIAIHNLSTSYLWKVKDKPLTLAFNLYLLRDSADIDLGPQFANVTSLTCIAQKRNKEWHLSVIEVVFDSEILVDVDYENGHKKYILWDLYELDKKDKNPKIIFKVEDPFGEHFEVYEEQSGGKYRLVDSYKPILTVGDKPKK